MFFPFQLFKTFLFHFSSPVGPANFSTSAGVKNRGLYNIEGRLVGHKHHAVKGKSHCICNASILLDEP